MAMVCMKNSDWDKWIESFPLPHLKVFLNYECESYLKQSLTPNVKTLVLDLLWIGNPRCRKVYETRVHRDVVKKANYLE